MPSVTYTGTRNLAGDVLGDNLLSNGHFTSATTGWTSQQSAALSVTVDGFLRVTNGAALSGWASSPITVESGALYRVEVTHRPGTSGSLSFVSTTATGNDLIQRPTISTDTTETFFFRAPATTVYVLLKTSNATSGFFADFDNIKVRKVLARGHATDIEHVVNPLMSPDAQWTKGTGWTIAGGVATGAAGSASNLSNNLVFNWIYGATYTGVFTTSSVTAGSVRIRPANQSTGTLRSTNGTWTENFTISASPLTATLNVEKDSSFAGNVDNVSVTLATGNTWSLDFDIIDFQTQREASREKVQSLDRSAVVYTYDGAETMHTFTTDVLGQTEWPFADEWLASVEGGEAFTFDPYGTKDQPGAPRSVRLESWSKQLVFGRDNYRYTVTVRED